MRRIFLFFGYAAVLLSCSCKKDAEIKDASYPYVIMDEIKDISDAGIVATAEIISTANQRIIEYGFVWSLASDPSVNDYKLSFNENINTGIYTGTIDNNLTSNVAYWVRPYVISEKYTVYGIAQQFRSQGCLPPIIDSISPGTGKVGSQIKIYVQHINSNPDKTIVQINGVKTAIIGSAESEITVEVPFLMKNALISVISNKVQTNAADSFIIITPWKRIMPLMEIGPHEPYYALPYVFSINGKGYFCFEDLIEYNPENNEWSEKKKFPGAPRYNAVAFAINNKGYIGLGNNYSEVYNDFWEYNPVLNDWKRIDDFPGNGTVYTQCFPINNSVFVGLGSVDFSETTKEFWEYNQITQNWSRKADFPFYYETAVNWTYSLVIDNKAYFGFCGDTKDLYIYDPDFDSWTHMGYTPGAERYFIKTFSINNIGYLNFVSEGYDGNSSYIIWKYLPASNSWHQLIKSPFLFQSSFTIGNCGYFLNLFDGLWRFDPSKL
jgi:hypothetical protein